MVIGGGGGAFLITAHSIRPLARMVTLLGILEQLPLP